MDIHVANESQIDEIAALLQTAYAEFAPAQTGAERASWDEYFNEEIPDVRGRWSYTTQLIATDADGRIVAAATYIPDASVPEMKDDSWPAGYAAMRLLAVHPDARGAGLGRRMTEECLRRGREANRDWFGLHTTHLMSVARDMYERMGFTRFPERDIPVTDDFVVIAYRLRLP